MSFKPLPPDWCFECVGDNGGKVIGSGSNPEDIIEVVRQALLNSQTEKITIHKRRRDYNPMLTVEEFIPLMNRPMRYYKCPACGGEFTQPPEGYEGPCRKCKNADTVSDTSKSSEDTASCGKLPTPP